MPTPAATTRLTASLLPSSRPMRSGRSFSSSQRSLASRVPEPGSRRIHDACVSSLALARAPGGQRMAGCREDHELVGEPAAHHHIGVALAAFDEADVDVEADHGGDHLAGVADDETGAGLRVGLLPTRDQGRQQIFTDREARGHAQRRGRFTREERLQLARLLEQRQRERQQGAPVLVDGKAAADAVEQRRAERCFERRQRGAGRRLRPRHAIGRRACRAGARQRGEDLELAQREAKPLIGFIAHCKQD